jgi:hypothetical protein
VNRGGRKECREGDERAEWEGVGKVPFVSESRLLEAVVSIPLDRWVVCVGGGDSGEIWGGERKDLGVWRVTRQRWVASYVTCSMPLQLLQQW